MEEQLKSLSDESRKADFKNDAGREGKSLLGR